MKIEIISPGSEDLLILLEGSWCRWNSAKNIAATEALHEKGISVLLYESERDRAALWKAKNNDEWITKWDGADKTNFEATKGGLSDSMKRAAYQWGIGRYLYQLDEMIVKCSNIKVPAWNFAKVKKDGKYVWMYWQTPEMPKWALPKE